MRDLNDKVHKKPEFQQKILTDLASLEAVERRWLGSVLGGLILAILNLIIFLSYLQIGNLLSGQPASIAAIPFILLIAAAVAGLVMNFAAFMEYFAFDVRLKVQRGMVIKKRRHREGTENDEQ